MYKDETEVERVKTFKFLSTYTSEDLTWWHNTQQIIKNPTEPVLFTYL